MLQVWPAIAGNRVGSTATLTGALALNARTYSKNGYWASDLPASSVFVIAAAAGSAVRRQRKPSQPRTSIRRVLMASARVAPRSRSADATDPQAPSPAGSIG